MSDETVKEREFAGTLTGDFLQEGYVRLDPQTVKGELPSGYFPDLIFRKGDETIVVELKQREMHHDLDSLRQIKQAIESKPDWHFRLYVLPDDEKRHPPEDNVQEIDNLIVAADRLNQEGQFEAALVVLWIALETGFRVLLTKHQSRPNSGVSGTSMARHLYDDGELDERELGLIDDVSRARNLSAHGYRLAPRDSIDAELFDLAKGLAAKIREEGQPAE